MQVLVLVIAILLLGIVIVYAHTQVKCTRAAAAPRAARRGGGLKAGSHFTRYLDGVVDG